MRNDQLGRLEHFSGLCGPGHRIPPPHFSRGRYSGLYNTTCAYSKCSERNGELENAPKTGKNLTPPPLLGSGTELKKPRERSPVTPGFWLPFTFYVYFLTPTPCTTLTPQPLICGEGPAPAPTTHRSAAGHQ